MNKIFIIISLISLIFISCEDTAPGDYIENYIVEALLIVDEPIQGISVIKTQPIFEKYIHDSAFVRNAIVEINHNNLNYKLKFRNKEDGKVGYFLDDQTILVEPNTTYNLKITLPNGKVITGSTTTPNRIQWTKKAKDYIQYPIDSLKLPATDTIAWTKASGIDFYLVSVTCLDTLEYGKYLDPPTAEKNRRIWRPFRQDRFYREITSISPIANTQSTIVWDIFRWYGLQEVRIFAPDWNYLRWFIQAQARQELDPLLSSLEGAYGYFGSTSVIKDTSFLIKNQP